jgi:DNA-binding NtrC family response regulator
MPALSTTSTPNHPASCDLVTFRPLSLDEVIPHLVGHRVNEVERKLIIHTLAHYCGSRTQSATILGISIRCLRNKIREYVDEGIAVPAPGEPRDRVGH